MKDRKELEKRIANHVMLFSQYIAKTSVGKSFCIAAHEIPIPKSVMDFCKNQDK